MSPAFSASEGQGRHPFLPLVPGDFYLMELSNLRDPRSRLLYSALLIKKFKKLLTKPVDSTPIFVFGKQRSGTTMLMYVFNVHPDTEVFNESENNEAFSEFRIRNFETIEHLVAKSWAPFVCFKPLIDSHLILDFARLFPQGRFIWIYRDFRDVANSALRKFDNATTHIRALGKGETTGEWFEEGASPETRNIIKNIYSDQLSEFDLACLVWWVRNHLLLEKKPKNIPNLTTIKYENIVSNPKDLFPKIFNRLGLRSYEKSLRYVHAKSISRYEHPELHPEIYGLCQTLLDDLDRFNTF